MHGRLKVRTTEEERERKKKEQALKVRAYKAAMAKIHKKRELEELDDEMLQITVQLLLRNPDISTLWNIRRETLLRKLAEVEGQGKSSDADDLEAPAVEQKLQTLYSAELSLTEQCLLVNPKSYNSWHHRCWTLEKNPHADWQREVQLCSKYLKLDERNFHTWDYWRYVTAKAGVTQTQEWDFCTDKIKVNFSNYSSWHHRSLLLPALYPNECAEQLSRRPISEAKLKEELEMVLTAAFTDPNDSSAWFYQRWLLGAADSLPEPCAFRLSTDKAVLAYTKSVALDALQVQLLAPNGDVLLALPKWRAFNANTKADTTWLATVPAATHVPGSSSYVANCTLEIVSAAAPKLTLPLQLAANGDLFYFQAPNSIADYATGVRDVLQTQLDSCISLLEYEPDSKWTLLTSALLMREIDAAAYHEKSLTHLRQLMHIDTLRTGYYEDLASKWSLEHALINWAESSDVPLKLDLSARPQLKVIRYPQYLCIVDDLQLSPALQQKLEKREGTLRTFKQLE